ncbi:perlucin-like protein isoform X2 [Clupea harengus]|uniref:Perlucin-like protein isoform X2 n=1 Tax=Clupea harengus TaxID=7950 RepID=A0A6P8GQX7_CLUHA|nr:perlucin-like protein isoform X2 [Clupea harengus]
MMDDEIYQNMDELTGPDVSGPKLRSQVMTPRWNRTKFMLVAMSVVQLCGIIVLGVLYAYKDNNPQQSTCVKAPRPCDSGWIPHKCKFYLLSDELLQWEESRQKCISAGGDLVTIDSEEEQSFLVNHIDRTTLKEIPFWIGLTDRQKEGQWLWLDGKSLQDNLTFWDKDQPDNGPDGERPEGQDCAWFRSVTHINNWMDGYCVRLHGRICAVSM